MRTDMKQIWIESEVHLKPPLPIQYLATNKAQLRHAVCQEPDGFADLLIVLSPMLEPAVKQNDLF